MKQFKVGDSVVHKSHGVGVIKSVETRSFNNNPQSFYLMEIYDAGAPKKVFVPVDVASDHLRSIVSANTVARVYELLESPYERLDRDETWNRRYRAFMVGIANGDILETTEVLKALWSLKLHKDLSFGERKLLDCAMNLLVTELSVAENLSADAVQGKIENALSRMEEE